MPIIYGEGFNFGLLCGFAALVFALIEFILCLKTKRLLIRCISLCPMLIGGIVCLAVFVGVFGKSAGRFFDLNALFGLLGGLVVGSAAIGSLLGFLLFLLYQKIREKL